MASVPIMNAGSSPHMRERRRGSVLISRVGQFEGPMNHSPVVPYRSAGKMPSSASRSPLYSNQQQSHSVDSFGSDSQTSPLEDHVTQVHHFPRKQSISRAVGGMLNRTVSSSRSKADLKPPNRQNVVIGVSVEEATVEHHGHDQEEIRSSKSTSIVQVSSKRRPSGKNQDNDNDRAGWVNKAKGLTKMVKRRSRAPGGSERFDGSQAPNES